MILFLDFETYYDDEYNLKKMAPPNYILDPRFEVIGCAVKEGFEQPSRWIDGPDFGNFIKAHDPQTTTTVTFNALFDNCILAWKYEFIPRSILCAMRMAVALRGHTLHGASLATVTKSLGLGVKGTTIENVKGMRRQDIINAGLWQEYQDYANNDNECCAAIFNRLIPWFPKSEFKILDRVLRCAVVPRFHVDKELLEGHLADLENNRNELLAECGITDPTDLRSAQRFTAILEGMGVEVEYKPSNTDPDRKVPCFAKTDQFMADLLEHDDPQVQALAAARLGVRSTLEQGRGNRWLSCINLDWSGYSGCNDATLLPMPLRYSGAHTHRLSGDWKYNPQNLPSGRGKGQTNKLRKCLKGPPGCKIVVADKSQIECRLNAWFCGQTDLLQEFANKGDPYSKLASIIFGVPVDRTTLEGLLRFIGKQGELGLGFGCASLKFYNMVLREARKLGMDISALKWSLILAGDSVTAYRGSHPAIVNMWWQLGNVLNTAWLGKGPPVQIGPVIIGNEGGHGYVEGPSGLRMWYGNPRYDEDTQELRYNYGKRSFKMYGAKFLENIIQFLARIDTMHDAMRISDKGYDFALQSHDELAWVVPGNEADKCLEIALYEMRKPPSWAPDLPLDAEGKVGDSYGDAK